MHKKIIKFLFCFLGLILVGFISVRLAFASTAAAVNLPFVYTFNVAGQVDFSATSQNSGSPYWWVNSATGLAISGGLGASMSGPSGEVFQMLLRAPEQNVSTQIYIDRTADDFSSASYRQPYNGEFVIARYEDANNYYFGGLQDDGSVVIKKKMNGTYYTLAIKKLLAGTYNASSNPDLIPFHTWIGLKLSVTNSFTGTPTLSLYTDVG